MVLTKGTAWYEGVKYDAPCTETKIMKNGATVEGFLSPHALISFENLGPVDVIVEVRVL